MWACEGEAAGVAEVGMGRDLGKAGKGRMRGSGCAGHPQSCTNPGLGSRGEDASDMGGKFGAFSAFRQMDGHALGTG